MSAATTPRLSEALGMLREMGLMLMNAPAEGVPFDQAFCIEIGAVLVDLEEEIERFGEALDDARRDLVSVRELASRLLKENARLLRDARDAGRPGSSGAILPFRLRTVAPAEDLSPCDVSSDGGAA